MGPGGHIDGDEWPWDAALRETFEETGVVAKLPDDGPRLVMVDVHHTVNGHVHYDLCHLLLADPTNPAPPPGESQHVAWFDVEEALVTTDGSHGRAIRAVLESGAPFPR
jgi:8-oxo-dGTP pyrophosphatase MutT (NUDIX family)